MAYENIKVSVIMGVYNADIDLLKKSIDSILEQKHKNLEFIICNDCSTQKNVATVLYEYSLKDPRVIILNNKCNSGLAYSLNRCLKRANGKYIARQDDDDISKSDRLDKEIAFLEKNSKYAVVGTAITLIDAHGIWGKIINKEKPQKEDFLFGTPFTHPTIMVRKQAYDAVNGYTVNKWTNRTEDYDLFMKMYSKNMVGYNLPNQLYYYRMDNNYYKKQKFKYRIDEVRVKYKGFKALGLFPKGYIYMIKPIISGILPRKLKAKLYRKRFK